MTTLRKGQVRLGPQTWAIIREAYLAGTSAAALARTYGCSLGTIRYRAVREGWRRCDAADEGPGAGRAEAFEAAAPSPAALADAAMAAAMRAVRTGRPSEAAAYVRVAEAARRMGNPCADQDARWDDEPEPPIAQVYTDLEARLKRMTAMLDRKRATEMEPEVAPWPRTV